LTVASLASVINPSGLIATSESRLDSIIERAASDASCCLVRSRDTDHADDSALRECDESRRP
jgi:hypothetical protein